MGSPLLYCQVRYVYNISSADERHYAKKDRELSDSLQATGYQLKTTLVAHNAISYTLDFYFGFLHILQLHFHFLIDQRC